MKDKFKELYFKCFNEGGTTKLCGRLVCVELIDFCEKRYSVDCGDSITGIMRVNVINELAQKEGII